MRFGRWTVLSYEPGRTVCRCECGTERTFSHTAYLRDGQSKSCGCLSRERTAALNRTHGRTHSREYSAWCNAKTRCYNPRSEKFPAYGGRGITMCPEWRESFAQFLADIGPAPPSTFLDRIDVDGHYEPTNCRWAPLRVHAHNKRVPPKLFSYQGEGLTVPEIAARAGVQSVALQHRVQRGESVAFALAAIRRQQTAIANRKTLTCIVCGQPFTLSAAHAARSKGACSRRCGGRRSVALAATRPHLAVTSSTHDPDARRRSRHPLPHFRWRRVV